MISHFAFSAILLVFGWMCSCGQILVWLFINLSNEKTFILKIFLSYKLLCGPVLTPGMLEMISNVTPQPGMVLRWDILFSRLWAKPCHTKPQHFFISTNLIRGCVIMKRRKQTSFKHVSLVLSIMSLGHPPVSQRCWRRCVSWGPAACGLGGSAEPLCGLSGRPSDQLTPHGSAGGTRGPSHPRKPPPPPGPHWEAWKMNGLKNSLHPVSSRSGICSLTWDLL